jgi:hypothetical protein
MNIHRHNRHCKPVFECFLQHFYSIIVFLSLERLPRNEQVIGSIPIIGSIFLPQNQVFLSSIYQNCIFKLLRSTQYNSILAITAFLQHFFQGNKKSRRSPQTPAKTL